jgi:DNA-3-methyladenine glycosylase II
MSLPHGKDHRIVTAPTPISTVEGTLPARPPFDFSRTLDFLQTFPPTSGEQTISDGALTKAVTLGGRAVAFTMRAAGGPDHPAMTYRFASEGALGPAERRALEDRVSFFLSLQDDLRPFYALARDDPTFAPVAERLHGLHQPKFLTPYENACWAIATQRTPLPVSRAIKARLVERYGTRITVEGTTYQAFPEASRVARADPAELEGIAGSARKAEYLRAAAEFFAAADEGELRHGDYDQVAARLHGVRGLGDWSTSFIMIRGLGRTERVPAPERELAEAAGRLYGDGRPLATGELRRLLDRYGPYQGYWAFYVRNARPVV